MQSIETANTSDAVGFITYVQSLKRKMKSWEKQVDVRHEALWHSTKLSLHLFRMNSKILKLFIINIVFVYLLIMILLLYCCIVEHLF